MNHGLKTIIDKYGLPEDDPLIEIFRLLLEIKMVSGKTYQANIDSLQEHSKGEGRADVEMLKTVIKDFVEGKINIEVSAEVKQDPPEIDYDKLGGAIVKALFPVGVQSLPPKESFLKRWFSK